MVIGWEFVHSTELATGVEFRPILTVLAPSQLSFLYLAVSFHSSAFLRQGAIYVLVFLIFEKASNIILHSLAVYCFPHHKPVTSTVECCAVLSRDWLFFFLRICRLKHNLGSVPSYVYNLLDSRRQIY